MNNRKLRQVIAIICCPIILTLSSCSGLDEKYGLVDMFKGKPKFPRMIPRQVLGDLPSGPFQSQLVEGILVMDSGADYGDESSLTYMTNLLKRYRTKGGLGDIPFHYFIDRQGKIFMGRQEVIPGQLHEGDPYTLRSKDISRKDLMVMRLSRVTKPAFDLNGYVTVILLGDYDKMMVNEDQEKSLFQLVSYLCFQHYISRDRVVTLHDLYPEIENPGFYLNNYLNPSILEKNIPPTPQKPHFLRVPGVDG